MDFVETVAGGGATLAVIVRGGINASGVSFFTPNDYSQQLAYMSHPAGKIIATHEHLPVTREVHKTLEVLFLRRGRLRVDFYDSRRTYIESRVLEAGDVLLLVAGGHGFQVLEPIEMFEVKQGPFAGTADKIVFPGVPTEQIRIVGDTS